MIGCVSELCRYTVPELMNGPADIASVGAAARMSKGPATATAPTPLLARLATALTTAHLVVTSTGPVYWLDCWVGVVPSRV